LDESTAPASSAEEVQPSTEVVEHSTAAEGTGASEQAAETDEQRRASEAGRTLAEQRRKNQQNAAFRRQFEDTQRQNAELTRALIDATRSKQPEAAPADEAPKREAFDSYEEWNRADARYHARKEAQDALRSQLTELSQKAQEQQYRQQAEQIEQAHAQRVTEFADSSPDFQELLAERGEHIRVPDDVAYTVMMAPDGPQIMDAMLRYPKLAQEFWNVPPAMRSMVLGKVSAALHYRPQVSKAPPPGKPVAARGGSANNGPTDSESTAEWMRKRNAADQAKR
jgi:hypothetical protein